MLCPIKTLSPYRQRWTIKGRCTYKSEIKTYNGSGGVVARLHLLDEEGGEIEATLWRDAVTKYFDVFEIGKVYFVTKAVVKPANRRFANVNNDHTLTIETWSIVQPAPEDGAIKSVQYSFVSIADVKERPAETIVDVCGIVLDTGEVTPLTTKSGKETARRDIKIGDQSGNSIEFAFWGEHAKSPDFNNALHRVVAVKNARVSSYNDKSLSTGYLSFVQFEPDVEECKDLKKWFDENGREASFAEISQSRGDLYGGDSTPSELTTLAQMKEESAKTEKVSYFTVKASVILFRKETNVYYPSCPKCSKKVLQQGDVWRCEFCDVSHQSPVYRYILSFQASDHTGTQWINCFDEVAKMMLGGVEAGVLQECKEKGDGVQYDGIFEGKLFLPYKFRFFICLFGVLFTMFIIFVFLLCTKIILTFDFLGFVQKWRPIKTRGG